MSDLGNDPAPQDPTVEEPKTDPSKLFSKGYNEGIDTQEKRVLKKFSEITGQEFGSIDDAYDWGKTASQKLAESISDPTATEEYKALQQSVNEYKTKLAEAEKKAQAIQHQYKFDSTHSAVASQLKDSAEFNIPENDVKELFAVRHDIEWKEGKAIVKKKDGTPLMDENGNYKPLESALSEFYKNYTKPSTAGTGGGSGDGGEVKPKFADYKAAYSSGNNKRQSELIGQAKAAGGWEEPDAPPVK